MAVGAGAMGGARTHGFRLTGHGDKASIFPDGTKNPPAEAQWNCGDKGVPQLELRNEERALAPLLLPRAYGVTVRR